MIRTLLLASTAGLTLLSALPPAEAADLPVKAVAAPVAFGPSWTGFYLGIHGGAVFDRMDYTIDDTLVGGDITPYHLGASDYAYGLHAGFDYQFASRWVAGAEFAYTRHSVSYAPFSAGGFGTLMASKLGWSVSARAGYLVTPETLLYARLGYAPIKIETESGFFGTDKKSTGALGIGLGVETILFGNWSARVEANYYRALKSYTNIDDEIFRTTTLSVLAGLSYRFNVGGAGVPATPPPAVNWNGFYAGIDASYNLGLTALLVGVPGASVGDYAGQSFGVGGFVGYNFVFGSSYLLGVEAGGGYLNAKFHDPTQNALDPNGTTVFGTIKGMYSASVRLGYLASPATLFYLKAGYAGLVAEANPDFFALNGGETKTLSAYQIGAGLEAALTDKLTLRVEGLYTKSTDKIVVINTQPEQNTLQPSLLSAKIGLVYHM